MRILQQNEKEIKRKKQYREELQGKWPAIEVKILAKHVAMKYIGKLRGRNKKD